jgi:hypothetical protein
VDAYTPVPRAPDHFERNQDLSSTDPSLRSGCRLLSGRSQHYHRGDEQVWIAGTACIFGLHDSNDGEIVRDVLPYLEEEDQTSLRGWFGSLGFNNRSRALNRAWSGHAERFPRSRKRIAFAVLFIVTVLAVVGYVLLY